MLCSYFQKYEVYKDIEERYNGSHKIKQVSLIKWASNV